MGKGEIARNEQFLLFPQCFLVKQVFVSQFVHIFAIIYLLAAELKKPKIGISGKGLRIILDSVNQSSRYDVSGSDGIPNPQVPFQTLCCKYSLESSHRDDSNEYPQHSV